jgi:nitrogen fixation protein FixH
MARAFTGWHMTAIICGFFGVVIAVNITMATLASTTFGGTVVDNSYVASQKFNGWIAAGRAQQALGWQVAVALDEARHVRVTGRLPAGAMVAATASHVLGRVPEQHLVFSALGQGVWRSATAVPAGRFNVHVRVRAAGQTGDFTDEVPA